MNRFDQRRIVVLSDLHANGRALKACLDQADAEGWDELVIAGDLLTYGPDGEATLDIVAEYVTRGGVVLSGNHDELYLSLQMGDDSYYRTMPPWLRESVDRTLSHIDMEILSALPWKHEHIVGSVLIAHANPFGPKNYRYLLSSSDHMEAHCALVARGVRLGVHGHTHRASVHIPPRGFELPSRRKLAPSEGPGTVNAGSVGQPRGSDKRASYVIIDICANDIVFEHRFVHYDLAGHLRALADMRFVETTRQKLESFWVTTQATPA